MKYQLRFYITPSGKQLVKNYIRQLEVGDITKIGRGIEILKEYGLNLLGTKWVKKINSKPDIFELRINGKKQVRLLFQENIEYPQIYLGDEKRIKKKRNKKLRSSDRMFFIFRD